MNIIEKEATIKTMRFQDTAEGEIILGAAHIGQKEVSYFMVIQNVRTAGGKNEYNCVSLFDGSLYRFKDDDMVVAVAATVTIER